MNLAVSHPKAITSGGGERNTSCLSLSPQHKSQWEYLKHFQAFSFVNRYLKSNFLEPNSFRTKLSFCIASRIGMLLETKTGRCLEYADSHILHLVYNINIPQHSRGEGGRAQHILCYLSDDLRQNSKKKNTFKQLYYYLIIVVIIFKSRSLS